MGVFFGRIISFGPLAIKISLTAIEVAIGGKSAELSFGDRSSYTNSANTGYDYQRSREGNKCKTQSENQQSANANVDNDFVDIKGEHLLEEINDRIKQYPFYPFMIVVSFLIFLVIFNLGEDQILSSYLSIVLVISLLASLFLTWMVYRGDQLKRTTNLRFDLDLGALYTTEIVHMTVQGLRDASALWYIDNNTVNDWKLNEKATGSVNRRPVELGKAAPPFINSNVVIWSLKTEEHCLFFMPHGIFISENNSYTVISYCDLEADYFQIPFYEDEEIPDDSPLLNYRWKYAKADGSPDRRFNDNFSIPRLMYGLIHLRSKSGFELGVLVSNPERAELVAEGFRIIKEALESNRHAGSTINRNQFKAHTTKTAFEILGVSSEMSLEEIRKVYRELAKTYHPDKFAHLGAEMRTISERRMKEINIAYDAVRKGEVTNIVTSTDVIEEDERRPCSKCGESLGSSSRRCVYCGEILDAAKDLKDEVSTTERPKKVKAKMKEVIWVAVAMCGLLLVVRLFSEAPSRSDYSVPPSVSTSSTARDMLTISNAATKPMNATAVEQTIADYYLSIEAKEVDKALSYYSSNTPLKKMRGILNTIANDTEYYRLEKTEINKFEAKRASTTTFLYHKKHQAHEEYWKVSADLILEDNKWKIAKIGGVKIR